MKNMRKNASVDGCSSGPGITRVTRRICSQGGFKCRSGTTQTWRDGMIQLPRFLTCSLRAVVLLGLSGASSAGEHCGQYPEVTQTGWPGYAAQACDCAPQLAQRYAYAEPEGLSLVAVCGFRTNTQGEPLGGFFFRGGAEVAGNVQLEESASGVFVYLEDLKFVDEASAIAACELPAITDAGECVARHARIGLTQLLVIEGESDEAGRWALQFDVVQLGAIRPCDSR